MRRREEPSPGPPSRRGRFCSSRTYWLDVRGRRVADYPISIDRRDVKATAWSPDQGRGRLILYVVVVDNPHKPATLGGMAGRALAHRRVRSRSCWNCFRGGWLHSHRPFPSYSITTLDGSGPRHYWCIRDNEQHCLLVGLPQQDGPYQVPATHTPCTGQYLLSTIQRRQVINQKAIAFK